MKMEGAGKDVEYGRWKLARVRGILKMLEAANFEVKGIFKSERLGIL